MSKQFTLVEAMEATAVDVERSTLTGVKLLGFLSESHKRKYPREAMESSKQVYEGTIVNIDHPLPKGSAPGGIRPAGNTLGRTRNVRVDEARGLVGDLHLNPKHPLTPALLWAAENDPSSYMMSHLADLSGVYEGGYFVTKKIDKVHAVDVVSNGGTTTGLFESAATEGEKSVEINSMTREALQAARPDLKVMTVSEAHAAETELGELKKRFAAFESENSELKTKLDGLDAAEKLRARNDARLVKITEAKLPEELMTEVFKANALEASDESFTKLLAERVDLSKKFGTTPTSRIRGVGEAGGVSQPTKTAKEFAAILKGGH